MTLIKNIVLLAACCFTLAFNYAAFGAEYTYLRTEVSQTSYELFVKQTDKHKSNHHIVKINSGGGSVFYGLEIIKYMRLRQFTGHKFFCIVEEYAASMAATILQTCDYRFMNKYAKVMQHRGYPRDLDGSYFDFLRFYLAMQRINISYQQFYYIYILPERHFGAKEALSIGYIDFILGIWSGTELHKD